jgi:hypothetical protein
MNHRFAGPPSFSGVIAPTSSDAFLARYARADGRLG